MPAAQNDDDDDDVISAINVTPLVDVTLVLLIIFMVTATYIVTNSIPVDLPEASTGEAVASDGKAVPDDQILAALRRAQQAAKQSKAELRAIISADQNIKHGRFVKAVDLVRQAGISRFAIGIQEVGRDDDEDHEEGEPR